MKLVVNNNSVERVEFPRTKVNKLVGILESGEILYINDLHANGVSCTEFDYMTQEMIDDRNDIDNVKSSYDSVWREAVASESTELGLDDYLQEMIDYEINYGDGYFMGHDTSDTHFITGEDHDELNQYYGVDIECFECVGGGTGRLRDSKFQKVFDQDLLDAAIEHERKIERKIDRTKPKLTRIK